MSSQRTFLYFYFAVFLLPLTLCEVSLKVLQKQPIVILECLVTKPSKGASVVMTCPQQPLFFKGCQSQCNSGCRDNIINCSESEIPSGTKYTYRFDGTNPLNHGEWVCSAGNHRSAAMISVTKSQKESSNIVYAKMVDQPAPMAAMQELLFNPDSNPTPTPPKSKKGARVVDPTYVIILLIFLALSLCLNIVLLSRSILYKSSPKIPINPQSPAIESRFLKFCIKLLCVENFFYTKQSREKNQSFESNSLISRQVPSKMSDCSTSAHIQPAILLDNRAYMETSMNPRAVPSGMHLRSSSFQSQQVLQNQSLLTKSKKTISNSIQIPQPSHFNPTRPSASQILYDDSTEPRNYYMSSNYINSLFRSNRNKSMNESFSHRFSNPAVNMNEPSENGEELPNIAMLPEDSHDDSNIKEAISSRVELSKEMINQAGSLLRRADDLLSHKEH